MTAPQAMARREGVAHRLRAPRVWRMRSHLSALLVVTMLGTFAVAGGAILLARLPAIERATQAELQAHVEQLAGRLELLLGTAQNRLELLDTLARDAPAGQAERLLDEGLRLGLPMDAVYRLSADGRVLAAGLGGEWLRRRHELLGSDLSANALFQAVRHGPAVAWSGRHMSVRGGARVAALAVRDGAGHVLIAEISPAVLLQAVRVAAGRRAATLWVVDRNGDVIVDTASRRRQEHLNIRAWPLMQARLQGRPAEPTFRHEGRTYHAAVAHSAVLGWDFVGQAPTGWANPHVRQLVSYMVSSFAGCLLAALLMAPFWAQRLTRPLQRIVRRAERTTRGEPVSGDWPRGQVAEFNRLASDLQSMAEALQERERKFLAIFNASPVPMSVTDAANAYRLLDVNEAWCRELRRSRDQVLGRTATEIGLWTEAQRSALLGRMQGQRASAETVLLRGDGEPMQAQVSAQRVALASQDLVIWAIMDIGPQRRIEQQLREMNQQLGERVAQRTEALAAANAELSVTVEQRTGARREDGRARRPGCRGRP
nr:PAS domain S-box protein [Variovorax boronicumulans]